MPERTFANLTVCSRLESLMAPLAFRESYEYFSSNHDACRVLAAAVSERRFKARYTRLLNDYEKIRPQLEELLKE